MGEILFGKSPISTTARFRCRDRGKASMWDTTVSKRSCNDRLKHRDAGVVPSAARPSKVWKTVHTLSRRLGKNPDAGDAWAPESRCALRPPTRDAATPSSAGWPTLATLREPGG